MRENYNTLDITKFIASIGVVAIHTPPLSHLSPNYLHTLIGFITSLCVPFFFVASSFLFFTHNREFSCVKLLHFIKRILLLYGGWFIIYLFITRDFSLFYHPSFAKLFDSFYGSWFYIALVISTVIVWNMTKINEYVSIIFGSIVYSYFVACHCGWEYKFIYNLCNYYTNGWFLSFPYAIIFSVIGFVICDKKHYLRKIGLMNCIVIILLLTTGTDIFKESVSWILRLMAVETIVIVSIKIKCAYTYKSLRNMSVLIFMIHFYIYHIFIKNIPLSWMNLRYVIVLVITLILSYVVLRVSRKARFTFLKYLY